MDASNTMGNCLRKSASKGSGDGWCELQTEHGFRQCFDRGRDIYFLGILYAMVPVQGSGTDAASPAIDIL